MSLTLTIEQAAARLPELVESLAPGDEIVLTADDRPVAKIVPQPSPKPRRRPGACKGMLTIVEDDDAHLRDFEPYM